MNYKIIIPVLILCVLVYFMKYYKTKPVTPKKIVDKVDTVVIGDGDISDLTDKWIEQVTIKNSPEGTANMFCPDGNIIQTVSQAQLKGVEIKRYFDLFSKKPGIKVLDKNYNITKVAPGVFINTAFIKWFWSGLNEPILTRMTFVFHNKCIFQLHSSIQPEVIDEVFDIKNLP